jgi:cell division protease FtsH
MTRPRVALRVPVGRPLPDVAAFVARCEDATDQPYNGPQERTYSDETAAAIDEEVRRIVDETFQRTVALLEARRDVLERAARLLLDKETIGEEELRALVGGPSAGTEQAAQGQGLSTRAA